MRHFTGYNIYIPSKHFTCLKSTIKTPMSTFSSVFVVDFGQLNVFWVSVFTPFAVIYLPHDILYTTVLSVVLF